MYNVYDFFLRQALRAGYCNYMAVNRYGMYLQSKYIPSKGKKKKRCKKR